MATNSDVSAIVKKVLAESPALPDRVVDVDRQASDFDPEVIALRARRGF